MIRITEKELRTIVCEVLAQKNNLSGRTNKDKADNFMQTYARDFIAEFMDRCPCFGMYSAECMFRECSQSKECANAE